MTKYLVKHKLGFNGANGKTQIYQIGDIVSFEEGDDVNVPFILSLGAIEVYEPYEKPSAIRKIETAKRKVNDGD